MDSGVKRIIKQALETYGFDVEEDGNELIVSEEDSNSGVRVTIEVVP